MDPAKEQPVSIEDSLKEAIAQAEENEEKELDHQATAETTEALQEEEETEETPEEGEEEITAEAASEETTGDEAEEETEETAELDELPPGRWSEEDKKILSDMPKEGREWLIDRHKQMEADYTRKTQEVAEIRKDFGDFYEKFAPYKPNLMPIGVTPSQYMERLVNADMLLAKNPVEGLKHVAQLYDIDLGQFAGQEQEIEDPEIKSVKDELAQLRNTLAEREQAAMNTNQQALIHEIQTFAEEKDQGGNLAHPYFNEVMDEIIILAGADRNAGRTPVLKDLYDKAVWASPSIRQRMLSDQQKVSEKKAQEAARAKAAKAKRAAKSTTGSSVASQEATSLSLREQLEKAAT